MHYRTSTYAILAVTFSVCMVIPPAQADVRFGKNVRIGGHDVSGQTFNKNRRGEFHIYNKQPRRPGCHWRYNADGSRTKVCHWKKKR